MIIQIIIGNDKNLAEDLPFYHGALEVVNNSGSVISRDWISTAQNHINKVSYATIVESNGTMPAKKCPM